MNNLSKILLCVFIYCYVGLPLSAEIREFVDVNGNKLMAILSKVEGDQVTIVRLDQKKYVLPISRFSAADQEYIRNFKNPELKNQTVQKVLEVKPTELDEEEYVRSDSSGGRNSINSVVYERAEAWPTRSEVYGHVNLKKVSEDADGCVYQSENFEYKFPTPMDKEEVRKIAEAFEATYNATRDLPHPWEIKKIYAYLRVEFYKNFDDYHAAGGTEGSGGQFFPETDTIMMPYESMGIVKTSTGYTAYGQPRMETVIHETFHQLTLIAEWGHNFNSFAKEGAAQLMDTVPYKDGVFYWDQYGTHTIKEKYGPNIPVRSLKQMLYVDGSEWSHGFTDETASANYRTAFIYYYYFTYMADNSIGGPMFDVIAAVRNGMPFAEAYYEFLLKGRTLEQVQDDIFAAYKRAGINLFLRE